MHRSNAGQRPYPSISTLAAGLLCLALIGGALTGTPGRGIDIERFEHESGDKLERPSEWFFVQRAWPYGEINQTARLEAAEHARADRLQIADDAGVWELAGPINTGGRISDLAVHPTNPLICYAGVASGGVFKTTDAGTSWTPTFDSESSLSIGSLTIDPGDPETIYVGTGESNGGGGSVNYGGTGVFKSTNGGTSWSNIGLPQSRHIGRIVVDPSNSNRVFAAVLGSLFSTGPDRGLYRSTNAGDTWEHVLASTDSTGAIDVIVHPSDSNIVYTAMWERIRRPNYRNYGGPSSGIFRSTDGGDTWGELTNGLPGGTVGRIGISMSMSNPEVIYAIYADADPGFFMGVYRTTDGGDSWTQTNDGALSGVYSSFGWWFGNIRVDPTDPDKAFVLGLDFYRTTNGGSSWTDAGSSMHVDHHALEVTADPNFIYEGNDGGMYLSLNGGTAWQKLTNLPATQFYTVEVDDSLPHRLYGGTQDNNTIRTLTGALSDWQPILGGDGFYCQVDPTDNAFVYAEFQWGNLYRSTNGGSNFSSATSGINGQANWSMPVMLNPSDPTVLYTGTNRVYRSTNRAASWTAISSDLTSGPAGGNNPFGTLTTVAVAETDPDVIWAGTDDGNVHRTTNGGSTWDNVSATLPVRWVTRVAIDPIDASIAYVTISGFRWDEPFPHVFRTTDHGATWDDISGNLLDAPVNDIVVDPDNTATLYVATDFGVYVTTDLGVSWQVLGSALPNVVVSDLELHQPTRTLTAGTFGRSMWNYDLTQTTAVAQATSAPRTPRLHPAAPNPFGVGGTRVSFELLESAEVTLRVYDVGGRMVATLAETRFAAGAHTVAWDGRGANGAPVADGVYFVELSGEGVRLSRKINVVR